MNKRYLELADRLRGELPDLDASIRKAKKSWKSARNAQRDQDAYLDSVALNLHAFYSGLEKLTEIWPKLSAELNAFSQFLRELSEAGT